MIAAPEDALKNLEGITLDPVDFSEVNLSNTKFSVKVSLPRIQNISNTFLADVDIDLTDYEQKSLEIPAGNITVKNAASTQSVKVTSDQLQGWQWDRNPRFPNWPPPTFMPHWT